MLESCEQAVMCCRNERDSNLLALQISDRFNACTIACHQSFGFADQADDKECLDGQLPAGGGRKRTGADVSDVDRARSDRGDDIGTGVKLAPVNCRAELLFIQAIGLRNLGRLNHGLVSDGDLEVFGTGML